MGQHILVQDMVLSVAFLSVSTFDLPLREPSAKDAPRKRNLVSWVNRGVYGKYIELDWVKLNNKHNLDWVKIK